MVHFDIYSKLLVQADGFDGVRGKNRITMEAGIAGIVCEGRCHRLPAVLTTQDGVAFSAVRSRHRYECQALIDLWCSGVNGLPDFNTP